MLVLGQVVERVQVGRLLGQHLGGEEQSALTLDDAAQRWRQKLVRALAVDGKQQRVVVGP